jgi:hypothetical protein
MRGPYDSAQNIQADLVLDHHLPANQCCSTAYRPFRFSVGGRQIEDGPLAVAIGAITDDRRISIRNLIEAVDYQSIVAGGLRTVISPSGPGLKIGAVIEITGQVIIV